MVNVNKTFTAFLLTKGVKLFCLYNNEDINEDIPHPAAL